MRIASFPLQSWLRRTWVAALLVVSCASAVWALAGASKWFVPSPDDNFIEGLATTSKVAVGVTFDSAFAIDVATGTELWNDSTTFADGGLYTVGSRSKLVIALGWSQPLAERDARFVAYDAATGQVRWNVLVGASNGNGDVPKHLKITSKLVIGAGRIYLSDGPHGYIVALSAKTGDKIWDYTDAVATDYYGLDVRGKLLAVVGPTEDGLSGFVRTLETKTGVSLGTQSYQHPSADVTQFRSVAVGSKAIVAGGEATTFDTNTTLGLAVAFDSSTQFLWSDEQGQSGTSSSDVVDVHVVGKIALAAGSRTTPPAAEDYTEGFVRAFDLKTGAFRWEVVREGGGSNDEVDDLSSRGKMIVGCGEQVAADEMYTTDVFGIDAKSGTVLWTAASIPEDDHGDCDLVAVGSKAVVFDADATQQLMRAVSPK